jgi:RHS repeat-associated protein
VRRYLYGPGPVAMTTPAGSFYLHADGLGSVASVTSSSGATQWTYQYEPFGAARTETENTPGAPLMPLRFTGHYVDNSTGLYHLRARQYDSASGRFLSTDPFPPLITDPYVSDYVYVNQRPTVLVDPSGLFGLSSITGAASGVVGLGRDVVTGAADSAGTAYSRYGGGFDGTLAAINAVNPTANMWGAAEQGYRQAGGGWSGVLEGFNQGFNPAYHALVTGDQCASAIASGNSQLGGRQCAKAALAAAGIGGVGALSRGVLRVRPAVAPEGVATLRQRARGLLLDETGAIGRFSIKGRLKAAQLPTSGRIRYVPPTGYSPTMPLPRGANKGYIDRFGNEWVRGPSRTPGEAFEWDVQLSRTGREKIGWLSPDGAHVNVSLGGRVSH